jgi:hypothetical protein
MRGELSDEKIHDMATITKIASMLVECTKVGNPSDDIGKAMSILSNADPFYVNMYVMGDKMLTSQDDNGNIVYGEPVAQLITQKTPVSSIKTSYSEVCQYLKDTEGHMPQPQIIEKLVRHTGWEEAIPSWSRGKWTKIMDKFGKCECLTDLKPLFSQEDFTEFVIVHQLYDNADKVSHENIIKCIINLLHESDNGDVICPITQIHHDKLKDTPLNMKNEFEKFKYQNKDLYDQFNHADFDVKSVNNCLKGTADKTVCF